MFKVGDKSESVTADRDGSRSRILTPEAVHEQAIHTGSTCFAASSRSLSTKLSGICSSLVGSLVSSPVQMMK